MIPLTEAKILFYSKMEKIKNESESQEQDNANGLNTVTSENSQREQSGKNGMNENIFNKFYIK